MMIHFNGTESLEMIHTSDYAVALIMVIFYTNIDVNLRPDKNTKREYWLKKHRIFLRTIPEKSMRFNLSGQFTYVASENTVTNVSCLYNICMRFYGLNKY